MAPAASDPARAPANALAVDVHGLGRDFTPRRGPTVAALAGLDLRVESGEVVGLLGHNGAGKTTTLRLLTGVLRPSRGRAEVLGLDPVADGPALRERVGVLTETAAVDPRLTGRENLASYAALHGLSPGEAERRSRELLARFDLAARGDDRAGGYSKGMRRRLALARSLLHHPELLLLDEPTADLDPLARRDVHALIRDLAARGRTVLLCTHDLVEAQALCDRVAVLRGGRRIALGTPAELASRWGERLTLRLELADQDRVRARELLVPEHAPRDAPGGLELTDVARAAVPEIVAHLVRGGIPLYAATPEPPTLEDAYVALHGDVTDLEADDRSVGPSSATGAPPTEA